MSIALLVLALALFIAFLILLGFLAAGATKALPKPGEEGKRGLLGGCALGCVAVFLGGIGVLGLLLFGAFVLASTAMSTAREVMELNPIESVRLWHDPEEGPRDVVHLAFDVRGEAGEILVDLVREACHDEDVSLVVWRRPSEAGADVTTYDIEIDVDDRDIQEFEEDVRRALTIFQRDLPSGVEVRFKGASRAY